MEPPEFDTTAFVYQLKEDDLRRERRGCTTIRARVHPRNLYAEYDEIKHRYLLVIDAMPKIPILKDVSSPFNNHLPGSQFEQQPP